MKRRVLNLLTVLSLALCVAAATMWVRSYSVSDGGQQLPDGRETRWGVISTSGRVRVQCLRAASRAENRAASNWRREFLGLSAGNERRLFLGFSIGEIGPPDAGDGTYVRVKWFAVPYWLLFALTALATCAGAKPLIRAKRLRQRREAGRCPACGYDLRATPGRCPECGTAAAVSTGG